MNWLLMLPMLVAEIVLAMELTPTETPDTCSKLGAASALLTTRGFRRVDRVRRHLVGPLGILGFVMVPFFYMVTRTG